MYGGNFSNPDISRNCWHSAEC